MNFNNATNNLFREQKTVASAVNYVVLDDDVIINISDTSVSRTVTLPAPSTTNVGKFFQVKDTSGAAATNAITVSPASGLIDGAASYLIDADYGAGIFVSDGTNYFIHSEVSDFSRDILIVASVSADPAPALLNRMYLVDTSGGSVTITLPDASIVGSSGKSVIIQKNTTDVNPVLVQTTSAQTINGVAPPLYLYTRGDAFTFTSDGANWEIQNAYQPTGILVATFTAAQSTNRLTGDHFKFDSVEFSQGGAISLDTTTAYTSAANVASLGRFTLQPGATYKLSGHVGVIIAVGGSSIVHGWYDSDSSVLIGPESQSVTANNGNSFAPDGTITAIFTPTVATRVELRLTLVSGSAVSFIGTSTRLPQAFIEVIN